MKTLKSSSQVWRQPPPLVVDASNKKIGRHEKKLRGKQGVKTKL